MRNLIAISAPSGTGKSTLCEEVRRKKPEIKFSVSCTTRPKRNYEKDGINYYFLSEDEELTTMIPISELNSLLNENSLSYYLKWVDFIFQRVFSK